MHQLPALPIAVVALALGCTPLAAQSGWQPVHPGIGFGQPQGEHEGKQSVQMVSSSDVVVNAENRTHSQPSFPLRFVIHTGLHINSHRPHSQFLIPTTLTLDQPMGVEIAQVLYPPGMDAHFSFAPKDPVSIYTQEFAVLVRINAKPGRYSVHGQLHYQACDDRACNPPITLPLTLNLTAK